MSQEVEINVDSLPLISRVSSVGLVEGSSDGSIYKKKKKSFENEHSSREYKIILTKM